MKIQYKNVGCIRQAELDLEPGKLVIIKGESNNGKSLMFYSLVDGFTNRPEFKKWLNNDALKENPKAIEWIGLFDDEGNEFQVEAGTNHLYYRNNKAKYEKVGRKTIFDVIEGQIPGLIYNAEEINPILNIIGEDSGMFPIDRSDSQIFKTYERLLSLSCTQDILRAIKLDVEDIDIKVNDLLKVTQSNNDKISKIDKTFETLDIDKLNKLETELKAYIDVYNQAIALYNAVIKDANYCQAINNLQEFQKQKLFDCKKFEQLCNDYITAHKLEKYIAHSSYLAFEQTYFDCTKAYKLNSDYSSALTLSQEIETENKLILEEEQRLKDIQLLLDKIDVCPYCGRPMEK